MNKNYVLPMQLHAMKDVKEVSQNLVSGEFVREYRGMEKKRGGWGLAVVAVAVGALAMWLLVLTVVKEVQIASLRQEVDQLTANMIAMSVNVKALNQKISDNRLFNEFKDLEDTIYADEDDIPVGKSDKDSESLDKLKDITVMENEEDMGDDEDMFEDDDDDAESGDWYAEYDNRREKVGTTNMVRLKPEDFTGFVVKLGSEKEPTNSVIREIKRLLNKDPETSSFPLPTAAPTSTAESDSKSTDDPERSKRSVVQVADEPVDQFAAPRVATKPDERRKTKKYTPSVESTTPKVSSHSISRTTRNSDDEAVRRRPFIAAHFHGNTSHLSPEIHEHYKGNGLVRVPHQAAHDVWYPAPWTLSSPHPRPTLTRTGHVHVHHTGVYLVYVQIYYLDTHDVISWVLHRTNTEFEGRDTLLQCAQSSHSTERLEKPNSCFSAAALFLRAGDRLAVRNTGGDRHSLMQPEKSFIGLVKLADAEDPDQEM